MVPSGSDRPLLFAVDAATLPASVALLEGEARLAHRTAPPDPRTDAWLHPALEACLEEAGAGLDDVEGFVVTVGPGTFTGIRVGLATCLGLAAPGRLPVCGIGTLEAVAEASGVREGPVAAALDARRGQVYGALYRMPARPVPPLDAVWGPRACDPPDFARVVARHAPAAPVAGNGRRLVTGPPASDAPGSDSGAPGGGRESGTGVDVGGEGDDLTVGPLAVAAGRLAARGWADSGPENWPAPAPYYVRGADVRLAPNPLLTRDPGPSR